MASSFTAFVPYVPGISRMMKSQGVQDALRAVVEPIAESANANFGLQAGDLVPMKVRNGTTQKVKFNGTPEIEPYGSYVDLGAHTAIGKVVCRSELGRYDNAVNNTILKSR